jgi:hypothetical protein
MACKHTGTWTGIGMEGLIMGGQDHPNEHVLGLVLCVIGQGLGYNLRLSGKWAALHEASRLRSLELLKGVCRGT